MTQLNWDREARQARLRKWLRENPRVDADASRANMASAESWAVEYVRRVSRDIRRQAVKHERASGTPIAEISRQLDLAEAALTQGDYDAARGPAQRALQVAATSPLTDVDVLTRGHVSDVVELTLLMREEDVG